jgi:hypothetical protein
MAFGGRWRGPDGKMKENWIRRNRDKQDPLIQQIEDELIGRSLPLGVTVKGDKVSDWDQTLVTVPELLARLGHRQMNYSVYAPVNSDLRGWVCYNGHFTRYVARPPAPSCTICKRLNLIVYWQYKIEGGLLYSVMGEEPVLLRFHPKTEYEMRYRVLPNLEQLERPADIESQRWEKLAAGEKLEVVPDENVVWEED